MAARVAVVLEHSQGKLRPISFEVAAAARAIAAERDAALVAVALGSDPMGIAQSFAADTGIDTVALAVPGLDAFTSEVYLALLPALLDELGITTVCIGHTAQGCDFAPGLAVALEAACITAVEGVARESDGLVFKRTTYNGKIVSYVSACAERSVITVQPAAFAWTAPSAAAPGAVATRTATAPQRAIRSLGPAPAHEADRGLADAEVIVAIGRGVASRDGVELAQRLAAAFPKGMLAGSRPVCDAGLLPYSRQVGRTGATVRPKVYLACGISGASQHVYGMRDSKLIVAVNRDPHAPIFGFADVGVAEDAAQLIKALLAEIHERA